MPKHPNNPTAKLTTNAGQPDIAVNQPTGNPAGRITELTTSNPQENSANTFVAEIDQLEPDIEFCVLADPIDAGIYDVTVVERGPGIDGRMSRQRITTTEQQDGTTLISAIVPR